MSRTRSSLLPLAASAGVAGITTAFVMAPAASATPVISTAPVKDRAPLSPNIARARALAPQAAPVQGNFGTQKIRVGVQIKDGAYVPAGTTTNGTKIKIVETGPNSALAVNFEGTECTTSAPNAAAPTSTETICQFFGTFDYQAQPGDTVTFSQETVNPGLVIDSTPQTIGPCVDPLAGGPDSGPACPAQGQYGQVTFTDPGLPPVAVNDTATTGARGPVNIAVLNNDDDQGAAPTVTQSTNPGHGTVTLQNNTFTYTPNTGFAGTDQFDYTLTTANGSSTATVTITVDAAPASSTPVPSSTGPRVSPTVISTPPTSPQSLLANTGARSSSLVGLGGALIGSGSLVVFAARRRRRTSARHASR